MNNTSDNSTQMTSIVVEHYITMRFKDLVGSWLKKAKLRIPDEVANIMDIVPEDLGGSIRNMCDCPQKAEHYIRYRYRVVMKDGTCVYGGAQCLKRLGFPHSLVTNIEEARRKIQNDIKTIQILDNERANKVTSIYQTWMSVVYDNHYLPGMYFLKDFGKIVNEFLACGRDLPYWLSFSIKYYYTKALAEAPSLKEQRIKENRERYAKQWQVLMDTNKEIWARNQWIKERLTKISQGEDLSPEEINRISFIERLLQGASISRMEKALPFLIAMTNGSIAVSGSDLQFLLSLYDYMVANITLSDKQFLELRKKYRAYEPTFLSLPPNMQLTTGQLVQHLKTLDAFIDSDEIKEIHTILQGRNVDLVFLDTITGTYI